MSGGLRWTDEQHEAWKQRQVAPIPVLTDVVTPRKPSKYRNKPTDGYASKKEAARALQLKLMQEAGEIQDLEEQPKFLLIPKQDGERASYYRADFSYRNRLNGIQVVEDVKSAGTITPVYILKRKLMLFVHKIRVTEV